jgi:catechol 2,3-dioxygenase-like lactoylglutathione lyase family enzyme
MPKYQFDHVHVYTRDPDKTSEFYQKMFGAVIENKVDLGGGKIAVTLDIKGTKLLVSTPWNQDDPLGLSHFGIRTDNLEKTVSDFKKSGVKFTDDITKVSPDFMFANMKAPEGVGIELIQHGKFQE